MVDHQGTVGALAAQHTELAALLTSLSAADWARPTRCAGWDVSDVVLHLAQTDGLSLASLQGELPAIGGGRADGETVDAYVARIVDDERGAPGAEVGERWRTGADALLAAFRRTDGHERVPWVAGMLSSRTLATTRLSETWIHTGDVAEALGVRLEPTDRLWHIARLAWRTLPYAFAGAGRELSGPVAFELLGPAGEHWDFVPDTPAVTVIRGSAAELCDVAGRRAGPDEVGLEGEGPDAAAVLELVRTYA